MGRRKINSIILLDDKKRGNCTSLVKNSQGRNVCDAMQKRDLMCGTKYCPFYKPSGCKDYIRVEKLDAVELWPPEERRQYWKERDLFEHETFKIYG